MFILDGDFIHTLDASTVVQGDSYMFNQNQTCLVHTNIWIGACTDAKNSEVVFIVNVCSKNQHYRLVSLIAAWHGSCSNVEKVVKPAQRILGSNLPNITDNFASRSRQSLPAS